MCSVPETLWLNNFTNRYDSSKVHTDVNLVTQPRKYKCDRLYSGHFDNLKDNSLKCYYKKDTIENINIYMIVQAVDPYLLNSKQDSTTGR